jgi:hypothetical protein
MAGAIQLRLTEHQEIANLIRFFSLGWSDVIK